jgi:hypothetical protein
MNNECAEPQLKSKIMRRIYVIFFCKKYFFNRLAFKTYLSVLLLWGLLSTVSVMNVFHNMMDSGVGFGRTSHFYKYAFMHTDLIVQIVTVSVLVFSSLLLIDTLRGVTIGRRV